MENKNKYKNLEVYTDGSCRGNGKNNNNGGWGVIITEAFEDNRYTTIYEYGGREKNTTNNIMEMTAVIKAFEYLESINYNKAIIYTDSAYIYNCLHEKWYVKWMSNGWKTSQKKDVLNIELWKSLISLLLANEDKISIKKVKGHNGIIYNEKADQIATYYADSLKEEIW